VTASLHFVHGPAFSVVEVTALAFLEHAEAALQEMAARTRQQGTRRLLINLIDVVGTFAPSSSTRSDCSPIGISRTSKKSRRSFRPRSSRA
jgi:hypothetical protein